jgi:glycosyltransferase involved in cell wall biosynthesis
MMEASSTMAAVTLPRVASFVPPRAPRVLQVVLSLARGGAERLVVEISKRIHPAIQTTVCCLDEPGDLAPELEQAGITVVALNRRPGFHPSLGRRIGALATDCGATVLHCHQYSPYVYGCLAALRHPELRIVYTEHGRLSDAPPSSKRRFANRLLSRRPADIAVVSNELRAYLAAGGFPLDRLRVVYNGIEPGLEPRQADRQRARAALGVGPSTIVFGTTARLDPVKDLVTLVEAFELARLSVPNAVLVIVGDGPERTALQARARALGVEAAVRFVGVRTDARALLAGFDLFVNCSVSEGVSLTILEAMAAGLPVVATNVGGTPEVVVDDQTGLLVPPQNAAELAAAMVLLAGSAECRLALGRAGRDRLVSRFSFDRMVDDYVRAYCGGALAPVSRAVPPPRGCRVGDPGVEAA